MKTLTNCLTIVIVLALCPMICGQEHDHGNKNRPKHGQIAAEFPGHKYAIEIAVKEMKEKVDDKEVAVPVVFAHVTDAHFNPVRVDAKEIRLNFIVDKKPKSFVLRPVPVDPKAEKDAKLPSVFELKDPELVKLIATGWTGNALVMMQVGKTPYNARLMKAKDIKTHNH